MNRPSTVGGSSAALSRELSEFLIELSIGLHKNAIYPPGHPLLESATSAVSRRLESLLQQRGSLSLGVARQQLIIEGVATEDTNPVLRDLASKLHRHHLGVVKFTHGVTPEEVASALATMAVDVGRRPRPLGLEGADVLQQWEHVRLYPLTFEQLQLLDEDPDKPEDESKAEMRGDKSRAAQLWIGLARAALAAEVSGDKSEVKVAAERLESTDKEGKETRTTADPTEAQKKRPPTDAPAAERLESTDPTVVAKAIDDHKKDAAYDQVVVGYLLQIAEELKAKSGKEAAALQKRISRLVATLQPQTLARLLEMGGDFRQRKKFVSDAAQGMAVDAVVELVQAAANTSGQTISHSLVRMLSKLAVHADEGAPMARPAADGALRESVQKLITDWQLDDPNPDGYRLALDKMSKAAPVFQDAADTYPCEPERLLQMGLEIGVLGEPVWRAVGELTTRPELGPVLDILDEAPEGWMREALWRHVATQDQLHLQLSVQPVDVPLVERLVAHMQLAAVDPLLDAIEEADDRSAATYVELLTGLGEDVAPVVIERLAGARFGVQRVLLALLGRLPRLPDGFDAAEYTTHPDPSVRREAVRMRIKNPATRDDTIAAALLDPDERVVRLALGAAMVSCPPAAAKTLMLRAADATLSSDVRALGIRALSSHKSPEVVAFLVGRTYAKRKLFRRRALASATPEMLAALTGLATHWSNDAAAREALNAAARSSDEDVRSAAMPRGGSAG